MIRFEDYYFSDGLRWTILILLTPLTIYLLFWIKAYWFVLIIISVIVFFFSTKYVTEFDTKNKVIKDLFYVFFIKSGKLLKYRTLLCIKIDKERRTFKDNSRSRDRTFDYFIYTGTLLYDNNSSLELTRKNEFKWFGSEMKRLAEELQIPIEKGY